MPIDDIAFGDEVTSPERIQDLFTSNDPAGICREQMSKFCSEPSDQFLKSQPLIHDAICRSPFHLSGRWAGGGLIEWTRRMMTSARASNSSGENGMVMMSSTP